MEEGIYPYFRALAAHESNHAVINGQEVIMVGSNNYLGLTHDPRVVEAAREATTRFGTSCTGSRFLNGTLELHEELERRLARFMGMEAALVFSTGYHVNLGVISCLVGKNDVVLCDRENHASIIDGCRLAFGEVKKFRHDDMEDLERLLRGIGDETGKLIVVDGVFSMNGSLTNLPAVVSLARRYGAQIMVDDAHGIGMVGQTGHGTMEHYGYLNDPSYPVDLVMGTFSKSLASIGGFIAGREEVIHYVKHFARPVIFSASPTPASTAAAMKALEIIELEPERVARLHENSNLVRTALGRLGYDTMGSETAIVPILVGSDDATFQLWSELGRRGLFANPVVAPATLPGRGIIRTSYMATHTKEDIARVIEIFSDLARSRGLPARVGKVRCTG